MCMKPLQGRQTTGKTELTQSLVLKWQMTSCHFYYRELEALESMTQCPCARGLVYGHCVMLSTSGRKYAMRDSPRFVNVKMRWPHNSPPALVSLKLRGRGTKWPTMAACTAGLSETWHWNPVQKHLKLLGPCSICFAIMSASQKSMYEATWTIV